MSTACDPRACGDGADGCRQLAQDLLESFKALDEQSKFYLLWAGVLLLVLLVVMDFSTLALLCLGLCIGGVAQGLLARRCPGLYAADAPAPHADDETQAINPAAAPATREAGAEADAAAQLRAIRMMQERGVLTPEQAHAATQQVYASVRLCGPPPRASGSAARTTGSWEPRGGEAQVPASTPPRVAPGPAPLNRGPLPRVDTTDVAIEPTAVGGAALDVTVLPAPAFVAGPDAAEMPSDGPRQQRWHAQGMA